MALDVEAPGAESDRLRHSLRLTAAMTGAGVRAADAIVCRTIARWGAGAGTLRPVLFLPSAPDELTHCASSTVPCCSTGLPRLVCSQATGRAHPAAEICHGPAARTLLDLGPRGCDGRSRSEPGDRSISAAPGRATLDQGPPISACIRGPCIGSWSARGGRLRCCSRCAAGVALRYLASPALR